MQKKKTPADARLTDFEVTKQIVVANVVKGLPQNKKPRGTDRSLFEF